MTVAIIVGTIIGSLVGVGLRWLSGDELTRDAIKSVVNTSVTATTACIVILTVIGAFPVNTNAK